MIASCIRDISRSLLAAMAAFLGEVVLDGLIARITVSEQNTKTQQMALERQNGS
jgi:hypothetical protein